MKIADKAVPVRAKTNQRKTTRKNAKKIIKCQPPTVANHTQRSSRSTKQTEGRHQKTIKQTVLKDYINLRTWATLMSAVGNDFLPTNDPRWSTIIRQRNKMMEKQKMGLQKKWGVTVDDAHMAVESGWLALRKFFLGSLCGGEFGGDNASREKWTVNFLKDDPIKLMERYLSDPILKSRAESRGKDFFTYVGQIADTKPGFQNLLTELREKKSLVKWYMLIYWVESPIPTYPPVCLWTDSSIANILGQEEEDLSLVSVRQLKSRLRLFAPRLRYKFVYTGSAKGKFKVFRK